MELINPIDSLTEIFKEIKAEDDDFLKDNKHLFVNLDAFGKLQEIGPFIFVGRKGVGKTALINQFKKVKRDDYDIIIDIVADQDQSWALYNFYFNRFQEILSNRNKNVITDVVDIDKLFSTAWAGAIQVTIMDRLLEIKGEFPSGLEDNFMEMKKYLAKSFEIDTKNNAAKIASKVQSLLPVIFELIQLKLETTLESVKSLGVFLGRAAHWLTESIEKRIIGEKANQALKNIISAKKIKILITLDKYDDYVDELIQNLDNKEQISNRVRNNSLTNEQFHFERENMLLFQRSMLKGLLLASKELRQTSSYDLTHYAYAIPQDRYAELKFREEAQFNSIFKVDINWNPISLLQYFVKRSCHALGMPNNSKNFDQLLSNYKKIIRELKIPEFIPNSVISSSREDFFLYLLRHTLWRPRDVQRYLKDFLELYKDSILRGSENHVADLISQAIQQHSLKIVEDEFILEYQVEYPHLESVILKFRKRPNVFSDSYLRDNILNSKMSLSNVPMSKDEIITRLFNVGFLGIRERTNISPNCIKQNNVLVNYSFYYNDGIQSINSQFGRGAKLHENDQWVIHPLFYDLLDNEIEEKFVVHEMNWDMVKKQYEFSNPLFE